MKPRIPHDRAAIEQLKNNEVSKKDHGLFLATVLTAVAASAQVVKQVKRAANLK